MPPQFERIWSSNYCVIWQRPRWVSDYRLWTRRSVMHGLSRRYSGCKYAHEQVSVWIGLQKRSSTEDIMFEEAYYSGIVNVRPCVCVCVCACACMHIKRGHLFRCRLNLMLCLNWSHWSPLSVNICIQRAGRSGRYFIVVLINMAVYRQFMSWQVVMKTMKRGLARATAADRLGSVIMRLWGPVFVVWVGTLWPSAAVRPHDWH